MSISIRKGFNIQASLFVSPDKLNDFLDLIKPIMERTMADPKCLFVEAYQSVDDPGHIRLVENWNASVEWFMTVRAQEGYVQEYLTMVEPLLTKPREIQIFNRIEGFHKAKE
ncbi:hypothetical protein B0I35DRAFT_444939 [Stachybotrys elegans]|uniref:ABM domain-containing protein n=1 Tax=Stachybotrys elegans TaxID=80388 RepID=A0A8K0SF43_9HYPO|nr:hypothetical protein B0I35DRAFT_444939 [Stachybotrys elegans]